MTRRCEFMICPEEGAVEVLSHDGFGEIVEIYCWNHFLNPVVGNYLYTWFRA